MSNVFKNLDWSVLSNMLLAVIPALICVTFHELSHGLVAYRLGDNTAKSMGRLTLNPIKHLDIMGLASMVLFRFGWAKPVPVNMGNFKNPKMGMAITALAGPVSNIIIAAFALFLYGALYPVIRGSGIGNTVLNMINTTAYLSITLAVFNLIPIPPLDGSKVLFSVMSDSAYYKLMQYERYGLIVLFFVLMTGILSGPMGSVTGFLYDRLFVIAQFAFDAVSKLL